MWPYWLILFLALIGLVGNSAQAGSAQKYFWHFMFLFLVIFLGLRHEVGADWFSYLRNMQAVSRMSFVQAILSEDPGYQVLNWFVAKTGGSLYGVNFVCAIMMMLGVSAFAKKQPLPWLALLVSVPYLLIVVAMGYTRQSAALGLVLIGLTELGMYRTRKFVFWVLLAALFHKSAVLMLPLAALSATSNRIWTFLWVGVTTLTGAYFIILDHVDTLWKAYVEADYQSSGGLIRVAMNAVPAALFLLWRNYLSYNEAEKRLWLWSAIFSLVTLPLVMMSSAAVDRVALYFIPIQLFVFSRLPYLFPNGFGRQLMVAGIVAYYAFVQFVWLNYSANAVAWLPYQNYFFVSRF